MMDKKSGVAQYIKEIQPDAHYTKFHRCSVSLSLKDVRILNKILKKTISTEE